MERSISIKRLPALIAYFRIDEAWDEVSIASYLEGSPKNIAEDLTRSWRDDGNQRRVQGKLPTWTSNPIARRSVASRKIPKESPRMFFDLSEADWESDGAIERLAEDVWNIFAAANPKAVRDAQRVNSTKSRKVKDKNVKKQESEES